MEGNDDEEAANVPYRAHPWTNIAKIRRRLSSPGPCRFFEENHSDGKRAGIQYRRRWARLCCFATAIWLTLQPSPNGNIWGSERYEKDSRR